MQFLCNANSERPKIQVLVRNSFCSTTIFQYNDVLRGFAGTHLATEVVSSNALAHLQQQNAQLRAVIQNLPNPSPARIPTPPAASSGPFVVALRLRAPARATCPRMPGQARCGLAWPAARAVHHLPQSMHVHDPSSSDIAPLCTRRKPPLTNTVALESDVGEATYSASGV